MQTTKRFLRLKETEKKVGLKRDSIYRGAKEGWFPRPVKITERCTGWLESELYRPADDLTLSREVRALIALGLTGPDVAATMRIPVLEVSRLLDQPAEL
jgi:prophage regulatory protein